MKELLEWLERNETRLTAYSIQEKADLAIAAGQDRIAVAEWQTKMRFKEVI